MLGNQPQARGRPWLQGRLQEDDTWTALRVQSPGEFCARAAPRMFRAPSHPGVQQNDRRTKIVTTAKAKFRMQPLISAQLTPGAVSQSTPRS